MGKDIQVIVFDLDGTLYQDTHHFDFYANRLCEKLNPVLQKAFINDYKTILAGVHPLKMGMAYDASHDLILRHRNGLVEEGFSWDGNRVADMVMIENYQEPLRYNFHSLFNIGDLWWVPAAVAKHYGITNELAQNSFMETREYMMTPEFKMKQVSGFKEILEISARSKSLVLLTNSPEKDSEVILSKLGFTDFFDKKIFNGQKPHQTKQHLHDIKDKYGVCFEEILCVGDNAINEILPAKELGCKTILIDPHGISATSNVDIIVKNIAEVVEELENIL